MSKAKKVYELHELTQEQVEAVALPKRGHFAHIITRKAVDMKRDWTGGLVEKETDWRAVRCGVDYDHVEQVKANRGVNTNAESSAMNAGLKGKQFEDGKQNYVLVTSKGNHLLRIYPNKKTLEDSHTTWYLNGKPIRKADIANYLYAKDKVTRDELPPAMDINMSSIKYIA